MKLITKIKHLSKRKKIIFSLISFVILAGAGFIIWAIATGFIYSQASTTPITNTASVTYQDKNGNTYGVESNTVSTELSTEDSVVVPPNSTDPPTTSVTSESKKTDTTNNPTVPQNDISDNLNHDNVIEQILNSPVAQSVEKTWDGTGSQAKEAYEASTLKPWAFWFLFGFIPLFLIATGIYYFLKRRRLAR